MAPGWSLGSLDPIASLLQSRGSGQKTIREAHSYRERRVLVPLNLPTWMRRQNTTTRATTSTRQDFASQYTLPSAPRPLVLCIATCSSHRALRLSSRQLRSPPCISSRSSSRASKGMRPRSPKRTQACANFRLATRTRPSSSPSPPART